MARNLHFLGRVSSSGLSTLEWRILVRGLWLSEKKVSIRDDIPTPTPGSEKALIRVLSAGICNTDLELINGMYPFTGVLGHEFVGVCISGPQELVGKRVVADINVACGSCEKCEQNNPNHCNTRMAPGIVGLNGGMAEYVTVPATNLHAVPDEISTLEATFIEPLAAAIRITQQIAPPQDMRVLLVGMGKLGSLVAKVFKQKGYAVSIAVRNKEKIPSLEKAGYYPILNKEVPKRSWDIAVDCTGNPAGFSVALNGLKPMGTLVLKSTYDGLVNADLTQAVVDEISIVGSRCGPVEDAISLLRDKQISVADLVSATYSLGKALDAIEESKRRGVLKVIVEISKETGN